MTTKALTDLRHCSDGKTQTLADKRKPTKRNGFTAAELDAMLTYYQSDFLTDGATDKTDKTEASNGSTEG